MRKTKPPEETDKYFDHTFKDLRGKDTRAVAVLFAGVAADSKAGIKNVTKRLRLNRLDPDCLISVSGERHKHIEAFASWRSEIPERIHGYAHAFRKAGGFVPETTVVVFKKDGMPAHVTEDYVYSFEDGPLSGAIRFRVKMLWKMKPSEVFALRSDAALPLVVLMNATARDLKRGISADKAPRPQANLDAAAALAADVAWCAGVR